MTSYDAFCAGKAAYVEWDPNAEPWHFIALQKARVNWVAKQTNWPRSFDADVALRTAFGEGWRAGGEGEVVVA